jgi:hypothetical protein
MKMEKQTTGPQDVAHKMVVVTTDSTKRGVFFGELVEHDTEKKTAVLREAQMAVFWSAETHGVLGLGSIGPQAGSRISPIVPGILLEGVTAIIDAAPKAVEVWRRQSWEQ